MVSISFFFETVVESFVKKTKIAIVIVFSFVKIEIFRNKYDFRYLNKFVKISLLYDKIRNFVVLFDLSFDFVNFVIFKMTKYESVKFVTIIVNRFNVSVLTISKIFLIFRKKFSRSFIKIFNKQKIFVFAFVRFVRRVQIKSSISNFFEIVIFFDRFAKFATFSNFSSRFFTDLFSKIATFFDFSFFCVDFANSSIVVFRKIFKKFFAFLSIYQLIYKKNVKHFSNFWKSPAR